MDWVFIFKCFGGCCFFLHPPRMEEHHAFGHRGRKRACRSQGEARARGSRRRGGVLQGPRLVCAQERAGFERDVLQPQVRGLQGLPVWHLHAKGDRRPLDRFGLRGNAFHSFRGVNSAQNDNILYIVFNKHDVKCYATGNA